MENIPPSSGDLPEKSNKDLRLSFENLVFYQKKDSDIFSSDSPPELFTLEDSKPFNKGASVVPIPTKLKRRENIQTNPKAKFSKVTKFIENLKLFSPFKSSKLLSKENFEIIHDLSSFDYKIWEKSTQKVVVSSPRQVPQSNVYWEVLIKRLRKVPKDLAKVGVCQSSSSFVIFWNLLTLALTMIYFFIIPLEITFGMSLSKEFPRFLTFKYLSLCLFFMDAIINCNTSIYIKGILCHDRKLIISQYIKYDLIIDFLSQTSILVNIYLYDDDIERTLHKFNHFFQFLFFLKLLRLRQKVKKIEEILFFDESTHYLLSLVKLILKIVFISHFFACIWYLVGLMEVETSWLSANSLTNAPWYVQYINSYYFICITMNTVGYGDITPKNFHEKCFSILLTYIVCGIFAYNLNSIGVIVKEMAKKDIEFERNIHIVNGYMKQKNIPFELKMRVRKYMEYICEEEELGKREEEKKVLSKLSEFLREELMLQGNGSIIGNLTMFSKNFSENIRRSMIPLFEEFSFTPGEIIFLRGDSDNKDLFIVLKGKVDLFFETDKKPERVSVLQTIKQGETFGELSFFSDQPRKTGAKSSDFTTLYRLKKAKFTNLLKKFHYDYQKFCEIKDSINNYGDFSDLHMQCYACKRAEHLMFDCPIISTHYNKDIVIRRHLHSIAQKRESKFHRRSYKASKSLTNFQDSSLKRRLYGLTHDHSFEKGIKNSDSATIIPDLKEGYEPRKTSFEQEEETKENTIFEEPSPTISKKREYRNKRVSEPITSVILEENSHFEEDTRTFATNNNLEPIINKKTTNDFFLLDLDSMKSWAFYFPGNNSEKLIGKINFLHPKKISKLIKGLKKIRNSMKKRSPASIIYQRGLNRWADFSEGAKTIRSPKKSTEKKGRISEIRLELLNQFHKFVASTQ